MKRWRRRPKDEEEPEEEEETEEEEDDEEEERVSPLDRWRQVGASTSLFDDDDEEGFDEKRWARLEKKVRAGRYKPRAGDPWNLHVLYDTLRDLGDL